MYTNRRVQKCIQKLPSIFFYFSDKSFTQIQALPAAELDVVNKAARFHTVLPCYWKHTRTELGKHKSVLQGCDSFINRSQTVAVFK